MSQQIIDYSSGGMRVAVIGGGISGIVASYLISRRNDVVLFEKEPHLGGHTYTVSADNDGKTMPVDMGFIVFNDPNYPVFNSFLNELGVERAESDMSFAFHDPKSGFMYAGTGLRGMLARWRNIISPTFWKMIIGMRKFSREAREDLYEGKLAGITIGEYMDAKEYSRDFEDQYLLPMTGAIWSAPEGKSRDFPAEALVRFFDNHVLLDYMDRPPWYYVKGGSQTYVRAFEKVFAGEIRCGSPASSIQRNEENVSVECQGTTEQFDAIVMATHADIGLKLLSDPSDDEKSLLSPWHYADNRVTLHTDTSFLPPTEAATASWNFIKEPDRLEDAPVGVSYHMNKLQRLETRKEHIVTLNPVRDPKAGSMIESVNFDHPEYSLEALATQKRFPELDGVNRTFFCGAYQGYGFHEDGAMSGERIARHFGESL
ncbi:FAD-dependent oxidoreductase [Pseudodesulfovibrio sp.]|nr:FAD-dependent oxidoreductase [Pseudodesulfovibrio sp.]